MARAYMRPHDGPDGGTEPAASGTGPMKLNHVVLTRFNLPSAGYESLLREKEGWLRSRVELFERYCLPSMRAQAGADAAWIIYFDPASPAWLMDWIERTNQGDFMPILRATVSYEDRMADIRAAAVDLGDMLVTSNLDNDDAVASDFLARVQAAAAPGVRTAIYLADGLIAQDGRVYHRVDRDNAFCSVAEPWDFAGDKPATCWLRAHNRLGETMRVVSLRGRPGWLQVVHGANVSNRVRGRMVSPTRYRSQFGSLLDDFPEPSALRLARDRVLSGPLRAARETSRAAAKRAAVTVLGPDGIDALKVRAARLPGRRHKEHE
ncbi:glycosyltransferase [Monashia sp. NPDC004114]